MLGVGIDWAEAFHDVALGVPGQGVIEQFRIGHGPDGITRLVARCLELEANPAEVRVVLETRHGLLVEALVDAGFTVLPVNPDLVARRRGPAKKKDDAEDARICCLIALDQFMDLRKLIPHASCDTRCPRRGSGVPSHPRRSSSPPRRYPKPCSRTGERIWADGD